VQRFLKKNINKIGIILALVILIFGLTSCRTNANEWYGKAYSTYGNEFKFVDAEGSFSFWQAILGWPISVLSYPIAALMGWIGKGLGNSYFWGIVFTTLIVRTIAWPIYAKTNSTSLKMTLIQPEMAKIQAKYAGRQDPQAQQKMAMEMKNIYKKYGMNPLGCFFTMLLQFPIFMAMYECVRRIQVSSTSVIDGVVTTYSQGPFALTNTKLFGLFEINSSVISGSYGVQKATNWYDIVFGITVAVLYVGVTFLSQQLAKRKPSYMKESTRRQVQTSQQEQQQKQMNMMNYVMLAMFFFISLSSTALAIYWLIGAIYQLFQSFVGRKLNEKKYYKLKGKDSLIINSK
jgi:YidC/Oxa1 family membrane protein insertase